MINQLANDDLFAAFLVGGILMVVLFIVLLIVISLYIWRWAIDKAGGTVQGLGEVFITLIIFYLINFAIMYILGWLVPSLPIIVAIIISVLIQCKIISMRHNCSMGEAFVAMVYVFIITIVVIIILFIVLFVVLVGLDM
jgi:hypothetical protein